MDVFLLRNARGRDFLSRKGRFRDGKGRLLVSNNKKQVQEGFFFQGTCEER